MTWRFVTRRRWALLLVGLIAAVITRGRPAAAGIVPSAKPSSAVAVLPGGCYWGVESVFRHVRGITSVTSGYASPVATGRTAPAGPAEAVRIVYDPSRISYHQILDVFFSVVHDPTQLDRQGPDVGAEYRSIVFVDGDVQRHVVRGYIDSLSTAHIFPRPIVTRIAALQSFQRVDDSQQRYAERHPTDPYIMTYDVPKVKALRQRFPRLYRQ